MTETIQRHALTARCPLSCLEGRLPARTFNALSRHFGGQRAAHPTVGHVAGLHRQGSLTGIRGLGVGGIEVIGMLLESAGLRAGPEAAQAVARVPQAEPRR